MTPSGACWSRILQRGTVQSLLLFLSLLFAPARSGLVNVTVDDTFGDPTTGAIPQYSAGSDDAWNAGSSSENCPNCHINPTNLDLNQIHDKTWHDTTILPSGAASASITVQFTGSAVYVFNILPNTLQGTITSADISFSIDGADPAVFTRSPDSSPTILYHQLVYSNTALDYGPHTLVMTPNSNSLILFDYLVYTAQDDDHSAPPPSASPSSMSTSTSASSQPSPSPGTVTSTGTPDDNPQSSSSSTLLSTGSSQSSSRSLSLSHNTSSSSSSSSSARFLNGSSQLSTGTSGSSSTPPASTTGPADGPSRSPSPSSHTPLGAIVGAVLGGIAALLLALALGVLRGLRRRTWGKPKPSVTPFRPETAQVVVVGSAANGGYGGYGRDTGTGTGTGGHGVDNLGDDVDSHGDGDRASSFAPSMVSTAPLISSSSSSSSEPRWLDEHHDRAVGRALLDAFDVRVRVPRPDSDIRTARRRASLRLGAATTTATVPGPLATPSEPSTDPEDGSEKEKEKEKEKRRAELARKLETLQSTRSALSSPDPTGTGLWVSRSASAANSNSNSNSTSAGGRGPGGDPETAIRDLEAEIAHLRAALTAMNARRLADSDPDPDGDGCHGDSGSELLPAYAE